ncbi:Dual specificity protein phosphatase 22-A [Larimichthys crocea]|uniref:Uncharacterized protein n=1 Tax=Larimichthys crocea TaxID=215358 RepID=A0ACD3R1E8_LARCR|nr:Dual specificity protein phosphatase 22-A [Larimichthys crocea]
MGNGMNKVVDGLYLGNIRDAENKESLSKNGITHILSVYNNAKPMFEVGGKPMLPGSDCLYFLWKFYLEILGSRGRKPQCDICWPRPPRALINPSVTITGLTGGSDEAN